VIWRIILKLMFIMNPW